MFERHVLGNSREMTPSNYAQLVARADALEQKLADVATVHEHLIQQVARVNELERKFEEAKHRIDGMEGER